MSDGAWGPPVADGIVMAERSELQRSWVGLPGSLGMYFRDCESVQNFVMCGVQCVYKWWNWLFRVPLRPDDDLASSRMLSLSRLRTSKVSRCLCRQFENTSAAYLNVWLAFASLSKGSFSSLPFYLFSFKFITTELVMRLLYEDFEELQ